MKIDRREFLKTAAVIGMFLPISEVYGSVSQRHVHRGSDACTPDVKYLPVSLKEVPHPKNIGFPVQHQGKTVILGAHYWYNAPCWSAVKDARQSSRSTRTGAGMGCCTSTA